MRTPAALVMTLLLLACAETPMPSDTSLPPSQIATFAGGCFWCMEPPFTNTPGVIEVTSGYTGGEEKDPTYAQVSAGSTGHRESIQVEYDPSKVSYQELLDVYWRQIDPTDGEGSFVDRGFQYTSAIFYHDEEQRRLAEESKRLVEERLGKRVMTVILPHTAFYPAEAYHQDYAQKSPLKYKYYRTGSGRDDYIQEVWHKDNASLWKQDDAYTCGWQEFTKPSDEDLRARLTPEQYAVTQQEATEQPFQNAYWDNHAEGIYVDAVSGEPLFSSRDKYDSGTGWPSFTKPIDNSSIITKEDRTLLSVRTEIRSKMGDSHLGHVFDDGPKDQGGLRFCTNSAALRFIPVEDLEKEGYGEYLKLFSS